jgi:hypothetical protein
MRLNSSVQPIVYFFITFGGRIDYYSEPGKGTEANIEIDL